MSELHLFDFDGTLFRSPDKPEWWDWSWYAASPSLDAPCVPHTPPGHWWVGSVVQAAREAQAAPDTITVLITGRVNNPTLQHRIPELLQQVGLDFDQVLLNPGRDTASWKALMTRRLLRELPVEVVHLWEDTEKNIEVIEEVAMEEGVSFVPHMVTSTSLPLECDHQQVLDILEGGALEPRWRKNITQRVADRHMTRLAARKAFSQLPRRRTASRGITADVLEAFGEFFVGRVAFGGLVKKLKQLGKVFTKAPKLWERFKKMVGVKSITELPKAIKELAKKGYQVLRKVVGKLFDTWPLKLYTLDQGQFVSINKLLDQLVGRFPQFKKWMGSQVKPRVDQFDRWLRKKAPTLSGVLLVAVYIWIWLNVVEFEWDLKSLADAFTVALSLSDLLASLPGSALGFLMNALNLGTFTLLPAAFAARLLWLMGKRYVVWTGRGFALNRERLAEDLQVSPTEIPT